MERLTTLLGAENAFYSQGSLCFSDMNEVSIYGDYKIVGHREVVFHITACDSKKRSTCKSREETAAFLRRSIIRSYSMTNIVVEDQFSSDKVENSNYKGD